MTPDRLLDYLIEEGAAWVRAQRDLHRPGASPLGGVADLGPAFGAFFEPELLAGTRFKSVPRLENPAFFGELERRGQPVPLDFSTMAGITFADTVLIARDLLPGAAPPPGLLFHELVHAVQYELLGIEAFVRRYVTGWAENGYAYEAIPLEREAYRLQARYEADPGAGFSVRAEVARGLGPAG